MVRHCARILLVLLVLGMAPNVFAQDPDTEAPAAEGEDSQYEELTAQAEELFTQGQYDESIALLERAYDLKPSNSNTLYNIARVYEEKGDLPKALEYYDKFVVAPKVNLEYRREALSRSKTIREILAVQNKQEEGEEPQVTEPETKTVMKPSPWRPVGYALMGIGGAAGVTGVVFGLLASGAESDFSSATDIEEARDSASKAENLALVADILYVSGAVIGITGLVMAIVASPTEVEATSNFDFQVGPNQVGATWTTRF